jgi:vitamin B12 transporter
MHQASVRIKPHVLLETDLWYTGYYKQVPSTTFDYGASNASQKDEDFRLAANLSCETDQWILKFRSGFLQNSIQYNDSAESVIATDNNSLSFINEIEGKWIKDPKNTLCIGVNQTLENASSQSYLQIVSRNRYAVYGRYNKRLFRNRLNMSFETRQELVEDKLIPFVFSLGCDAHVYRGVNIKGIVAKHYAMPIYDDLFWKEDAFARGNPLLDPEYGWNFEMGTEHKTSVGKMNFTNELTVFYQHTIDQIIWMPEPLSDGTTGKWMPQNVDECKSGGMELTGRMISNLGNSGIDFRYQYTFTNSIILDNISGTVNRNPRIYIPRHNASLSLGYSLSRISLMYTQSFTGKCYYDNYHTMKAFTTGDMQVDYNLECRILCVDAYVRVRNLYNATYQIIKGYAQPPRNYSVGINLTF